MRSLKSVLSWLRRKLIALPAEGWLETELEGFKWRLLLSNYIDRSIAAQTFETRTSDLVGKIVKPGMRVLDIGANIGYYTLHLAKSVGSSGKVYAFEPTQQYREQLLWHINKNGFENRVEVIPFGLSDRSESLEIEIDNISATLHQIRDTDATILRKEKIQLEKLDVMDEQMKLSPIHFVKVDIDGHEPFMLTGGLNFFRHNQPLMLIEFSQISLDVAGSDVREVKKMLDDLGYTLFSETTLGPMNRLEFLRECGDFSRSANAWAVPSGRIQNLAELF